MNHLRPGILVPLARLAFLALAVVLVDSLKSEVRADMIPNPISIDTTSLDNTDGFIAFQLSPSSNAPPVTATISNLEVNGQPTFTTNEATVSGDVSGTLATGPNPSLTLDIQNGTALYVANINYGNTLSFVLSISGGNGTTSEAGSMSTFSTFLADSQGNPVPTTDATNDQIVMATVTVAPDGSAVIDYTPYLIIQPTSVPEPSSLIMAGAALLLAGAYRFARQGTSRAEPAGMSETRPFVRG